MTRKKILVIGANGFTGRRILDDLSRNLSYQTTGCSLHDDICPHSGDYRFIRTDICNRQAVEKLFQEVQPDVVINTSALSVPDYCETHQLSVHFLPHPQNKFQGFSLSISQVRILLYSRTDRLLSVLFFLVFV